MADQTPQPFQAALSDDLVDTKGGAKILSMFSEFLCSEKMEDNTRAQYVRYVKYYITPEEEQNQKSFAFFHIKIKNDPSFQNQETL